MKFSEKMKFSDLSSQCKIVRVKPINIGVTLREEEVFTVRGTRQRGVFELSTKESCFLVTVVNAADVNVLTVALAQNSAYLAYLKNVAADGSSAELQLALFFGSQLEMGNMEIGIDESVLKAVNKSTPEDAAKFLSEQSILKHGEKKYFFMVAGEAAKDYLETGKTSFGRDGQNALKQSDDNYDAEEEQGEDEATDTGAVDDVEQGQTAEILETQKSHRYFAVLGSDWKFSLSEKDKGNGETIFMVSGLSRIRNRPLESALRLAYGDLKFVDWTCAGERGILAKRQLESLVQDASSYLKTWDTYGETEGELFLKRARTVGAISFVVEDEAKDGTIRVRCNGLDDAQREILSKISELDVVDVQSLPEFLNAPTMTFLEYSQGITSKEEVYLGEKQRRPVSAQDEAQHNCLKIKDFYPATNQLYLSAEDASLISLVHTERLRLVYSIVGEIAQIKRRMAARNTILAGRSTNPALGLLIEEKGKILPAQKMPKMKALTALVKRKVFPGNPPTLAQERTIEVALNTPDIALIQGPPGTGKTTVIAAIIERLNQESDKREGISGQVLLSGFQHDAVENMIGRLTINGLPVPKFGRRSQEEDGEDFSRFEQKLQDWCQERVKSLQLKHPQITESLQEENLRRLCVSYIKSPTFKQGINVLGEALRLPEQIVGGELRVQLQAELRRLRNEIRVEQSSGPHLITIRSLRVTEAGFADDGAMRASDLLSVLKDDLDIVDSQQLLEQASRWNKKNECPPFLPALKSLKGTLLKRYSPRPVFRREKPRDTVIELIEKALENIRLYGHSTCDKKDAALAELLQEMENNPYEIVDSVKDYSFAFAATCQQSVSKTLRNMKGLSDSASESLNYEFVIIDEAARVSPRDLMIPMSQGKRIVLVGDHRQLPQLIDEEVARCMEEESKTKSEKDWLKESMFEYLFTERIPALEKADGILRHVTLDKQFRTNPVLGDFVSKNFYEYFNPEEKFQSGLDESYFSYDLPGTKGKCAIWINVPLQRGHMGRRGTSCIRDAEAEAICKKLREWLAYDNERVSTGHKPLTFGVISFYKGQSESIKQKLSPVFLDSVGPERLRIGTVDSFQGMEFDVVFLSLVRTGVKGFGFLQLYNRLNVSMSRQKKLLVVVGDAAFYDSDIAREKVPGIANFLTLCRSDKGEVQ